MRLDAARARSGSADRARVLLSSVALAAAIYLGGRLGDFLAVPPEGVATLWPPNAIALGAIRASRRHRGLLLGVLFVASFAADWTAGFPWTTTLVFAVANVAEVGIALALLARPPFAPARLDRLAGVLSFAAVAAILAPAVAALGGAAGSMALRSGVGYWRAWSHWLLGDGLGNLTLAPAVYLWLAGGAAAVRRADRRRVLEAAVLGLALVAATVAAFGPWSPPRGVPLRIYAPVPMLLWAAVRFGPTGAATANAAVTLLALALAGGGKGPFYTPGSPIGPVDLQLFVGAISIPLLVLAAVAAEREAALAREAALRDGAERMVARRTAELAAQMDAAQRARDEAEAARREADRANAAKSDFLARMSHDLRNPLSSVVLQAEVLVRDPSLPEAHRRRLATVRRGLRHLASLVDDLLDLARSEAGTLSVEIARVDVPALVGEVDELMRVQAEQKGIALEARVAPDAQTLDGDAKRLRRVLENLVGNAVKFTSAGRVVVDVAPADGGRLRFSVDDTGPGIAREDLDHVFQPFRRGRHGGRDGAGLGLAISRQLVELMGGDLQVESRVGEGTRFWFELPATRDEAAGTVPGRDDAAGALPH